MPHQPDFYDTDSSYLGRNETAAVSGRRIANFFDVADPYAQNPDSLQTVQAAVRELPTLLPRVLDAVPAVPDAAATPHQWAEDIELPSRITALAEWLCGKTTQEAAEMANLDSAHFGHWASHIARSAIGMPAVYELVVSKPKD